LHALSVHSFSHGPLLVVFFFFQAEDGIRDFHVTGVQTCALPIYPDSPRMRMLLQLVEQLVGFPRHLSQHVGGFVISHGPLSRLVPIENAAMPDRTVIQWDKNDLDELRSEERRVGKEWRARWWPER